MGWIITAGNRRAIVDILALVLIVDVSSTGVPREISPRDIVLFSNRHKCCIVSHALSIIRAGVVVACAVGWTTVLPKLCHDHREFGLSLDILNHAFKACSVLLFVSGLSLALEWMEIPNDVIIIFHRSVYN